MLSRNFALSEMIVSETAQNMKIDNNPDIIQISNMKLLCYNVLQKIRDYMNLPIYISSGFRSEALNTAVKSSTTSAHKHGLAADIKASMINYRYKIIDFFANNQQVEYDQIIYYPDRFFFHIGLSASDNNRRLNMYYESDKYYYVDTIKDLVKKI